MRLVVIASAFFSGSLLYSQIGGMGMPRFPGSNRSPQQGQSGGTSRQSKPQPTSLSTEGTVRQIDDKSIIVEGKDTRLLTLRVTSATRFLKDGAEISGIGLKVGDQVSIQATQDDRGYLTASRIDIGGSGAQPGDATSGTRPSLSKSSDRGDGDSDRPVLRRADSAPKSNTSASSSSATEEVPKEAANFPGSGSSIDSPNATKDDPGRPVLKRGAPARKSKPDPEDDAAPSQVASAGRPGREAPAISEDSVLSSYPSLDKDPLISRAREQADAFTTELPNYVCQQFTTRYQSGQGHGWQALDVVSASVVYENGKEDYRNIQINGKPIKRPMEEMDGSWSTGEFGTVLRSILSPRTAADFRFIKESQLNGFTTGVYDYAVSRERSDWRIQVGGQSIIPGYKGRIWIDKKSARVLRIEMQAVDVPEGFPMDKIEAADDYGFVRLETQSYLLPTHAENLSCERGTNLCSRNAIDFRNYHKYSGEATITFDK